MVQFLRFQTSQLFVVAKNSSSGPGFFAYFISKLPDPVPETIAINDSWDNYVGFYLFMKEAPASDESMEKFAADVTAYFNENYADPDYTGFAWLEYDNLTSSIGDVTVVTAFTENEQAVIAADMSFNFRNYSMPLKKSAPIIPVRDADSNIVSFTYEYPPYEGTPQPRQAFNIQLPLSGNARGALLGQVSLGDLSNNVDTGWNASLYYVVNIDNQDVAQNYPLFETGSDQGLQILFNYMLDPVDPLNPDRSYLAFTGTIFFLKQNVEGKWYIELDEQSKMPTFFRTIYGKKIDLIPLVDSDYPPKLIFEELPPVNGIAQYYLAPAGDFELAIRSNATADGLLSDYFQCGLSGTEYIQFTAKSTSSNGDVLRFVAKQNAYAPVFPIVKQALPSEPATPRSAAKANEVFAHNLARYLDAKADGVSPVELLGAADEAVLTGTYKTSWINIRPNPSSTEAPIYCSQPNDAALYDHDGITVDVSNELLQLRNTPAALFPAEVTQSLAMVPYAGVSASVQFSYDDIQQFEKQVIVAARSEAIATIPITMQTANKSFAEDMLLTTTPQGLLATVPQFGLDWQSVLLAKSQSKGMDYNLEFADGVTKELRDALQSNQLFMVATEAAPLGTFLNKITIADWPFTINVGKGSDKGNFGNIVIFKFAEGSIEERVKDTQSWANASVFNTKPTLVSKWISSYIETTKLNAQTDDRYDNFLQIVQNPRWNGILVLKVDIGVENFPDDLKGLLAGINKDEFYAHHFGLEINFIAPDIDGKLTLPKSSMFALINYVDKDYRAQNDITAYKASNPLMFSLQESPSPINGAQDTTQELYDFKVLTLQVVFQNSEIKDFSSKIQLTTTAWFDEPAQLNKGNLGSSLSDQTIAFNGSYEKHNGVNTYTFVTRPEQTYKFLLQSQTMNYVEIVKAQFYTITEQAGQHDPLAMDADKEAIVSRFIFWGYMNFKLIDSFDVFSFGDSATQHNTHNTGLYFANLNVDMDFMLDNISGETTDRVFTFDPTRMSFDISQSTPRSNSLFSNFPINLSGLIYSKKDDDSKPADLGYLPVIIQSPTAVKGQSLTEKWYSLLYNLNLGSMGALAAKAGFVSQISTAWSPDTDVKRLATGIKLPGMGGQKTLSLQSVLSLNIQSFTFISAYDDGTEGNLAYLLKFNNVKLSLLGKKLPGAADTQFILFGDATGADKTTLAWYAAYYAKPKPPTLPPSPTPSRPPQLPLAY